MSDLRPKPVEITLDGKTYGLLFTLNVIDDIQDKTGLPINDVIDALHDDYKRFKTLKTLLALMINEYIDEYELKETYVTERYVGRKIGVYGIEEMVSKIASALTLSYPEEDGSPNPQSE
jgi:arginine/lysine/ornithine decarboxylase